MNPIVGQLWDQRQQSKKRMISLSDADNDTNGSGSLQELAAISIHKGKEEITEEIPKFKHPSASRTTIDYPFSEDDFLREAYCSPGGTMRFGKILEDLDALAGNIAFHHVVGNPMLVTAAVDRIALQEIPRLEKNQRLSGQVTWVGNSSMENRMQFHEVKENDSTEHAHLIMDALLNVWDLGRSSNDAQIKHGYRRRYLGKQCETKRQLLVIFIKSR